MTIWYYLFSVFVSWTRPTVNTFMLPLLPNSVFAFYTCAVPAHWSLAGFKCVLLTSWFLESKPDRQWPRMLQFSVRRVLPEEELLNLCRVWNQTVPLQKCIAACLYLHSVVQMYWKLWKSSKSTWPFQETPPRPCADAHRRVGVPRGWGGRSMTVVKNTQF